MSACLVFASLDSPLGLIDPFARLAMLIREELRSLLKRCSMLPILESFPLQTFHFFISNRSSLTTRHLLAHINSPQAFEHTLKLILTGDCWCWTLSGILERLVCYLFVEQALKHSSRPLEVGQLHISDWQDLAREPGRITSLSVTVCRRRAYASSNRDSQHPDIDPEGSS